MGKEEGTPWVGGGLQEELGAHALFHPARNDGLVEYG